ncbi:hypothetical protein [Streptomyces viridosporus]|uniref:hypothetical protein n=1 Tax=Streptomyces viridosporus TaxID=67581 RepID=UPI00117BF4A8|nr:hypothetical protein [Streptomyces viridosporus]
MAGRRRPREDHVTARRTLGSGPESSAPTGAAQADLLDDLPSIRLPDLAELRQGSTRSPCRLAPGSTARAWCRRPPGHQPRRQPRLTRLDGWS